MRKGRNAWLKAIARAIVIVTNNTIGNCKYVYKNNAPKCINIFSINKLYLL